MAEKPRRKLPDSRRPKEVSDEEWEQTKEGFDNLITALTDLGQKVGADVGADLDDAPSEDAPAIKLEDAAKRLLVDRDNASMFGRTHVMREQIEGLDAGKLANTLLTVLEQNDQRQFTLYPADGTGVANCILEKLQFALNDGKQVEQVRKLLAMISFNLNVPLQTRGGADIRAFILPHGGLVFQADDSLYKVGHDPIKEIIINKADFIEELTELSAVTLASENAGMATQLAFLSHDDAEKTFTMSLTPPRSLLDHDQCVTIMFEGIPTTGLRKLNHEGCLSDLLTDQRIIVLRACQDRVIVYGCNHASSCHNNDNVATDETLAAIYSTAYLRDWDTPVKYEFFHRITAYFARSDSPLGKHFVDRTAWLCKQVNFPWVEADASSTLGAEVTSLAKRRILDLGGRERTHEDGRAISCAGRQYENCMWHPDLFSPDRTQPVSYPHLMSYFAGFLTSHPNIFIIKLSLKMFADIDELRNQFARKVVAFMGTFMEVSESDLLVFDDETKEIGLISSEFASAYIDEIADGVEQILDEGETASFADALESHDKNEITLGFCRAGLPLNSICQMLREFSEEFDSATLWVPHLGIYQSFLFGDLDSGNVNWALP